MSALEDIFRELADPVAATAAYKARPEVVAVAHPKRARAQRLRAEFSGDPERMPWPDRWFEEGDPADWARCRTLWQAVLLKLVRDLARTAAGYEKTRMATGAGVSLPSGYLGSRDWHMVCALAGMDGSFLADRLRVCFDNPCSAASFLESLDQPSSGSPQSDGWEDL